MKLKLRLVVCTVLVAIASTLFSQISLVEKLKNLPGVVSVDSILMDTVFLEQYDVYFEQLIDHNKPECGTFNQRVIVSHAGFDKPVVANLYGYAIWHGRAVELTKMLKSNQVNIEHRFFVNSRPDSIPWSKLTVWQAATDQHKIIKALQQLYPQNWLTTGVSKGGQTTIFHRSIYPTDVKASVPYVAPLNYAREDERIYEFLETVGSDSARQKVFEFQYMCFENFDTLLEMLKTKAKEKKYSYEMGFKKALEYTILEYSFALWQYGGVPINQIPDSTATAREIFEHLGRISSFTFFEDKDVEEYRPFFWAALTEIGMYGYKTKPFEKFLGDTVYTFDFTAPKGTKPVYSNKTLLKVKEFLDTDANNMLFIVGGNDTWGATAYYPSGNNNLVTKVLPGAYHGVDIKDFPLDERREMMALIAKWMETSIDMDFGE